MVTVGPLLAVGVGGSWAAWLGPQAPSASASRPASTTRPSPRPTAARRWPAAGWWLGRSRRGGLRNSIVATSYYSGVASTAAPSRQRIEGQLGWSLLEAVSPDRGRTAAGHGLRRLG